MLAYRPVHPFLSFLLVAASFGLAVAVTGCGVGTEATGSAGELQISGSIHGGQQPVGHATVQVFAAGKTGNGSAATTELLPQTPVTSDDNGVFTLTGKYACANAEDQVYLVASGGNPGLAAGTNNTALLMVSLLGRCADLLTTPFVSINELTTVAAAWAAAPFMKSATQVGTTASNAAGLKNAFLNSRLLVDPYGGALASNPANLVVESGKVSALANAIASCVNTNGSTGAGSNCRALFSAATPSGGTAPTDTLTAALTIVKNPGSNVLAVYNLASTLPPFANTLTRAPSDWTMSVTVTGAGIHTPTAVALDKTGNVWVADNNGLISAFSPQGTPFNSGGYGSGVLGETYGLVVDSNDNIWATIFRKPFHNPTYGSVAKFTGYTSGSPGILAGSYYDTTVDFPYALAADTNGNVMAANYGNASATVFDMNGGVVRGGLGSGNAGFPESIAVDQSHGLWLANSSDTTVTHVTADGTILARPACCSEASGVAVDAVGNAWIASYGNSAVVEVSAAGTTTLSTSNGGVNGPGGVVIDGAQDVWVVNYRGFSITHIAGNGGTVTAGTALSPANGFGLDASLETPFGIAVDATGNLWVSNNSSARNDLVMFMGLATPTKTPVSPVPAIP